MVKKYNLPIFIVCGKSPHSSEGGGYANYALSLAKILHSLGKDVYVVSLGEKNSTQTTDYGHFIERKVLFFDGRKTALPGLLPLSILFTVVIRTIVREKSLSRYIVWGIGPWSLTGCLLKMIAPRQVIVVNNCFTTIKHEWHGALKATRYQDYGLYIWLKYRLIYYFLVPFMSVIERFTLSAGDYIITNYQSTNVILQKEFKIADSKIKRIPFFIKSYVRNHKEESTKISHLPSQFILSLSRQDARKGINFLLRAMKILKDVNIHIPLILVGSGSMLEANKKLANKLGIQGTVKFLGYIPDTNPLLKKATLFCLPTIEEGAGAIAVIEAMQYSKAIVTTVCDGIGEDIKNNISGLLIEPGNPEDLASAIIKILHNPRLTKRLGANAKHAVDKRVNFHKFRREIASFIDEIG